MKHKNSKIGFYGITFKQVDGYKTKKGRKILPHLKKVEFKWNNISN